MSGQAWLLGAAGGSFRYHAIFKYGAMELEHEDDDLQKVKSWIANQLKEFSNPTLAVITDRVEDKVIFEERNPYDSGR